MRSQRRPRKKTPRKRTSRKLRLSIPGVADMTEVFGIFDLPVCDWRFSTGFGKKCSGAKSVLQLIDIFIAGVYLLFSFQFFLFLLTTVTWVYRGMPHARGFTGCYDRCRVKVHLTMWTLNGCFLGLNEDRLLCFYELFLNSVTDSTEYVCPYSMRANHHSELYLRPSRLHHWRNCSKRHCEPHHQWPRLHDGRSSHSL